MLFGTVKLNDGQEMPAIAFGSGSKWKDNDVTEYVGQAIEIGFSHLDSAEAYHNEQYVGAAIYESGLDRSEMFVTTKYSGRGSISESIQRSLSKLGLKYVDLYLLHDPVYMKDFERGWREFEKIREEGFTKGIGVSNFSLPQLKALVKIANVMPAVDQISFDPYNYTQNKDLLAYAAKHNIVVAAYCSLTPITKYPGGPVDKPIAAAAKRLGATHTQVILSWVKAKGVAIVTTSSSKEHLREYLAVADLPSLTEDEIIAIDEAGAQGPSTAVRKDRRRRIVIVLFVAIITLAWAFYIWLA